MAHSFFCIFLQLLCIAYYFSPLSFNSLICLLSIDALMYSHFRIFVFMNLYVLVIIDFSFFIFFVYLCFSPSLF